MYQILTLNQNDTLETLNFNSKEEAFINYTRMRYQCVYEEIYKYVALDLIEDDTRKHLLVSSL